MKLVFLSNLQCAERSDRELLTTTMLSFHTIFLRNSRKP